MQNLGLKLTITVILSGCEESSFNGYKANSLSRLFKLDSSHPLEMIAMVNIFIASGFELKANK